jgi:hypothetical protein
MDAEGYTPPPFRKAGGKRVADGMEADPVQEPGPKAGGGKVPRVGGLVAFRLL